MEVGKTTLSQIFLILLNQVKCRYLVQSQFEYSTNKILRQSLPQLEMSLPSSSRVVSADTKLYTSCENLVDVTESRKSLFFPALYFCFRFMI